MKQKILAIFYLVVLITILAVLFLNSELDLNANISLYSPKSFLGIITEVLAELPLDFMVLFSSSYLLLVGGKKKSIKKVFYFIGGIVFGFIGGIYTGFFPLTYIRMYYDLPVSPSYLWIVPLMMTISYFLMRKLYYKYDDSLLKLAVIFIMYFVISFVINYAIKLPFGRMRFRDMGDPIQQFTSWFVFNGFTGNDSFPSGHVLYASFAFYLVHLSKSFLNNKFIKEEFLYIFTTIWVSIVGLGRVIIGAHFLSDVTMGAILGFLIFLIMRSVTQKTIEQVKTLMEGIT